MSFRQSVKNTAVRWDAPGMLTVVETERTEPARDELTIAVDAVGICGTDLHGWKGHNARLQSGTVLGHEFGGTVVRLGGDVSGWSLGDRLSVNPNRSCGRCSHCAAGHFALCPQRRALGIHLDGGLTSYFSLEPEYALKLATDVDGVGAALVEPLAVGIHAVERAGVQPGMRVGVLGAGPVGLSAAWAALQQRATVAVVDPDPARRESAERVGASATAPGDEHKRRWDCTLDAVGLQATFADALRSTRTGGTVCVVGLAADAWTIPMADLIRSEKTVTGAFCYSDRNLQDAAAAVSNGQAPDLSLNVVQGLDAVPALFKDLAEGRQPAGKTVVVPQHQ